jgi:hypothetical protein
MSPHETRKFQMQINSISLTLMIDFVAATINLKANFQIDYLVASKTHHLTGIEEICLEINDQNRID